MRDLAISATGRARGVEWLCVRECLRFSLRHRRYFLIFVALYWHSVRSWTSSRAARYGYCFLQLFDDIMDGDRDTEVAPALVAEETIAAWTTGRFRDDGALAILGAAFHGALESLAVRPGDDPHRDVLGLLRAMRLDGQRRTSRMLLGQPQLDEHLRTIFYHSLNLLLIASRVRTRAAEVPDLVRAMAWCSVVRDFDEDLRAGLVNVPADLVAQVRAAGDEVAAQQPMIRKWLDEERLVARRHLARSAATLSAISFEDPRAGRLLGLFQRSIERYARQEQRH